MYRIRDEKEELAEFNKRWRHNEFYLLFPIIICLWWASAPEWAYIFGLALIYYGNEIKTQSRHRLIAEIRMEKVLCALGDLIEDTRQIDRTVDRIREKVS